MKKSLRNFARALVDGMADLPVKDLPAKMKEVVALLAEKGLLARRRELEKEIGRAWKEKFGVSKVTIVSAHAVPEKTYKLLEELAPGAEIVERVDNRLMGGAILRLDEKRIDGSIVGALQRLKNTLLE